MKKIIVSIILLLASAGCTTSGDDAAVRKTVQRYNDLITEGYRSQNMTKIQEVATEELANKAFFHMAAIGEGRLRMDSVLKKIEFKPVQFRDRDHATVETREVWDFTQYELASGKKYYEEKDFVYTMGYELQRTNGRWMIVRINTIAGESTNNTVPWPMKSHEEQMKDAARGGTRK